VLIGAGFGMLFGLVSYAVNRRRRDFTSTMQVIATNYQVIVEAGLVNRARNVLAGQGEEAAHVHAESRHGRAEVPPAPVVPPGSTGPSAPAEDPTPSDVPVGTAPPEEPPAYGERPPRP
jgi:hypothetical protein